MLDTAIVELAPPSELLDVTIAPLDATELHLVLKSWHRSFRAYNRKLGTDAFHRLHGATVDVILSRFPLMLAARPVEAPRLCVGFIVAEPAKRGVIVHWVQVKKDYWQMSVAKRLVAAACEQLSSHSGPGVVYTHSTRWNWLAEKHGATFEPIERALRLSMAEAR